MFRFFVALLLGMVATFGAVSAVMAVESFEGKVLTVSDDHHLTISHQDDQKTFVVNGDTKITLDGESARWEDIRPGFSVTVMAENEGDRLVARSVTAFANE